MMNYYIYVRYLFLILITLVFSIANSEILDVSKSTTYASTLIRITTTIVLYPLSLIIFFKLLNVSNLKKMFGIYFQLLAITFLIDIILSLSMLHEHFLAYKFGDDKNYIFLISNYEILVKSGNFFQIVLSNLSKIPYRILASASLILPYLLVKKELSLNLNLIKRSIIFYRSIAFKLILLNIGFSFSFDIIFTYLAYDLQSLTPYFSSFSESLIFTANLLLINRAFNNQKALQF